MGNKPVKKGRKSTSNPGAKRVEKQRVKAPIRKGQKKRKPILHKGLKRFPQTEGIGEKQPKVGYGHPPVEHQFKPGQSGHPGGPGKGRTHLWSWFCRYMDMTPRELAAEKRRDDLTYAQLTAIKQVEQIRKRGLGGTAWLATREAWNRDEGKPSEHLTIDRPDGLSDQECDQIRRAMKERL